MARPATTTRTARRASRTARVREWERGFLDYVRAQYPQVGDGIRTSKALGKDLEPDLKRAIEGYTQIFGAGK